MNSATFFTNQMIPPNLVEILLAQQATQGQFWRPIPIHNPYPLLPVQPLLSVTTPSPLVPAVSLVPTVLTTEPLPPLENIEEDAKKEPQPCCSTSEPFHFEMGSLPIETYYPTHFMRGTQLQVADGSVKKVEDLSTDDFLKCVGESTDVMVNASVVVDIVSKSPGSVSIVFQTGVEKTCITLKCQVEHPFFVMGKGWSSFDPKKSGENYGLDCSHLEIGDICVVLTRKEDELTADAVDIVTAQRDAEQFSQRAALREQVAEIYYEHVSGRTSAPPERIVSHPPSSGRIRFYSE